MVSKTENTNQQLDSNSRKRTNIAIVDVAQELYFFQLSMSVKDKNFFCDLLHFSPKGYDKLADLIFNCYTSVMTCPQQNKMML